MSEIPAWFVLWLAVSLPVAVVAMVMIILAALHRFPLLGMVYIPPPPHPPPSHGDRNAQP